MDRQARHQRLVRELEESLAGNRQPLRARRVTAATSAAVGRTAMIHATRVVTPRGGRAMVSPGKEAGS